MDHIMPAYCLRATATLSDVMDGAIREKVEEMQQTGSILVVDNESTIVDLLVEFLTDEGYVAYGEPDGERAYTSLAYHIPALILLDIRMPGLSGAQVLTRLHDRAFAPIPIVLMTASPTDAEPLLVPGLIECLRKPFTLEELLACVARHVHPLGVAASS